MEITPVAKLNRPQLNFLRSIQVPLDRTFDATGMRRRDYPDAMREIEAWVAYGVTPCREGGHTLRTRSGHCLQCKPSLLSYQNRHGEAGYVHLAYSMKAKLVKVGSSKDLKTRIRNLNQQRYGKIGDWTILDYLFCENAGKVEFDLHRRLAKHKVLVGNDSRSQSLVAQELFSCSGVVAIRALKEAKKQMG